jgi:hypothetical protein
MMKKIYICLVALFLAACLRLEGTSAVDTPQATNTATPSPTNTPTVIWFPPTDTPVITPSQEFTPTPEAMVELGEVLYEDHFNSSEGWSLPKNERGQINIGNGEINIIINEPGSYFSGTREKPDVGDFYAEITANPVLCSSRDEYGFLFSVYGGGQYYRLALTCSGDVRLDRLNGGDITILYPWTRNASVPPGAPSVTQLGVLVVEGEIHIYINGNLLTSIEGQQNTYGSFGVYGRTVGDTAMTVSFSELIVRAVLTK